MAEEVMRAGQKVHLGVYAEGLHSLLLICFCLTSVVSAGHLLFGFY